jgi:hypothetical protein
MKRGPDYFTCDGKLLVMRREVMLKKSLSLAVAVWVACVMLLSAPRVQAQTTTGADTQATEKMKADVAAIGIGQRVSVRLRDKKKLTGHLSYIGTDSFVLTDLKTDATQTIAYSDATQVERKNSRSFSNKAKIGLLILGGVVILSLIGNGTGG